MRYPSSVTLEDVNLLLDVLITVKDYTHSITVLRTYAGVVFKQEVRGSQCAVLCSRLFVSLVHLQLCTMKIMVKLFQM